MGMVDLSGKTALVTGGSRGLGAGMARALGEAGASVMLADVLEEPGRAMVQSLSALGIRADFVPLDVTDDSQWVRAVDATLAKWGGLDILVNNAGVEVTALVVDIDAGALRHMLDVNVVGTALGMKHALRAMRPGGVAGRGGAIVNIASVAATIAFPAIAGYSASKSAIDRLTRVAAMESGKLGYGVRVNCVYPGLVPTDMGMKLATDVVAAGLFPTPDAAVGAIVDQTPLGRLGTVEDMADAVAFLCSDGARFITGVGLPVDGGMGM